MENDREKEFSQLFEKHSDELFRHCLLRLSNRERALDLTQETFLRALEYAARGQAIREYRPFLYRILNNLIVDEYRRRTPQSLDALLEDDDSPAASESELLRDPDNMLEEAVARFDAALALDALKELSDSYRSVIMLRYLDGLSLEEIAHSLNESQNAVSVRIHRGLKKLKTILQKRYE